MVLTRAVVNKKSAMRAIPGSIVKLENVSSTRVADCTVGFSPSGLRAVQSPTIAHTTTIRAHNASKPSTTRGSRNIESLARIQVSIERML